MHAKKIVCFFSILLLLTVLMCSVDASPDTTLSFRGSSVTINLTFIEEAHPAESIWHNITITAITTTTLRNFTVVIKAPVGSGWQEIFNAEDTFSKPLPVSYNLPLSLPQGANGTLYCFMYVNTTSIDCLSTTLFTTQVREMTYSELLDDYNELLVDYTALNDTYYQLLADYDDLNNTYNDLRSSYETLNSSYYNLLAEYTALNNTHYQLLADYGALNDTYSNLQSSYVALNSSYNELSSSYNSLNSNYNALQTKCTTLENNYNTLSSSYNDVNSEHSSLLRDYKGLQFDYDLLNSTRYSLQANYTSLQTVYDSLNQTYNSLEAALIDLQEQVTRSETALGADQIVLFIFVVVIVCLIVFIIYVKRKQSEPYLVIRKETVAVKKDEKT